MERLIALVKNKYVIATFVFAGWLLFFDRHDLSSQFNYYSSLKSLQAEKAFYVEEIERIEETLDNIEHDPAEVERIAREKYQMKRDGEDIYVILRD